MPRAGLKSKRSSTDRRLDLAAAIKLSSFPVMVAYSNCARSGDVCYFSKERSTKCSYCLRKNIDCDGSFSLEEFRRVVDEKKSLQEKSRRKRKEIARLRRALADVEAEDSSVQESLAHLDEVSSRMIRRELQALGVLEEKPPEDEGAFADLNFPWSEVPFSESVD
ncbi:hypothetical protein A1O3_10038 [Capronia epimyces CBS 606.96]|uniref:Zn(2)-C6 fungal-type domain-containing protein n=1 Tax=Capronia epimyces CBS 606.96 TaxID=1182542 RepID=W9Y5T5_9EURO|nr:uncharacterized protein A1O3_10038 [Capronia epimyces CBS 606.96]EXJ77809.1 hypothetical protein A1O3_10038 [Capronia epimyces CBS 606.96]